MIHTMEIPPEIYGAFCIIKIDSGGLVRMEISWGDTEFWANVLLKATVNLVSGNPSDSKEKVKDILRGIGGYKDVG